MSDSTSAPRATDPWSPGNEGGDTARPATGALQALLSGDQRPDPDAGRVRIVDTPEVRVRNQSDLMAIVLYIVGIAVVFLATIYAHRTTVGVAADVQGFNELLGRVLIVPVRILSGLVTLIIPTAVLIELGVRRLGRQIVESISAAALGLTLGLLVAFAIHRWGTDTLIEGFSVRENGRWEFTMPEYVTAIGGLLTAAGSRARRRSVAASWNLLWITIGIHLITGAVSLPGILTTVLLGRISGLTVRYVSGVRSERAYGTELLTAIRRAGFRPQALVRIRDITESTVLAGTAGDPMTEVDADGQTTEPDPTTATAQGPFTPQSSAIALALSGGNRVYAMFDQGHRHDVVVLDGDRQVVGILTRLWRSIRLRGVEGRAAMSLRAVAERTALLSYAATNAGVRTPRLLGVGTAADSVALVTEHARDAIPLRDLPDADLTDDVLTECWRQLTRAHGSGVTHRALTSDVVLVARHGAGLPRVWLTRWEQGDIASPSLTQRMDVAQMIALLALRVGAERAVASAVRVLPEDHIAALGPMLQSVVLPNSTREQLRQNKDLLKELREALLDRLPEADVEPVKLARFGARTIAMLVLTIVAVTVVVTTFNFDEIATAIRDANPLWAVVSFAFGLLTWVGAALAFVAFSPVRLSMWRTILVQAAASFVALAVPAGIGPAALNLRMLTKRNVATPMAVATVALVQVSQFVVTIVLLVILVIFTRNTSLVDLPSTTILSAIAAIAVIVVAILVVPRVRVWLLAKIRPTLEQVWPRLSQMLGQPRRIVAGLIGTLTVTLGYVLAFNAALLAFGQHLSWADLTVTYLAGNALGAILPTPGGMGGVEAGLTGGLQLAGVARALSLPIAVLFRVTTYWARIPIGWAAMRYLQRTGEL